jgi:DNA-binding beta-propeller fold protein YncE
MKKRLLSISLAATLVLSTQVLAAPVNQPLRLLSTTPLPAVTGGDFDHFAADLTRNRLYVSAEDFGSIEVFDLPLGGHLASEKNIATEPHKILLGDNGKELFIADAGSASLRIVDTRTFQIKKMIPMKAQPDSGIADDRTGIFYVGNGGVKSHEDHAEISLISVADGSLIGNIGVPAGQIKAMAIDKAKNRLYVNFRDRNEIGIIDLGSRKLTGIWKVPGPSRNSAMAFDPATNRLFIGSRNPGKLFVLDTDNGAVVQALDIVETSDEIIFDPHHGRLYVAGSNGLDVVRQVDRNHYSVEQHVDTFGGKTAILIPSLERLYVVHTKGPSAQEAGLQVFSVQ